MTASSLMTSSICLRLPQVGDFFWGGGGLWTSSFLQLDGFIKKPSSLKGLSHEIDFKNVDKKPGLTKGRGWFLNFLEALMILKRKKYI